MRPPHHHEQQSKDITGSRQDRNVDAGSSPTHFASATGTNIQGWEPSLSPDKIGGQLVNGNVAIDRSFRDDRFDPSQKSVDDSVTARVSVIEIGENGVKSSQCVSSGLSNVGVL